jgi:hypothetical protein
MMATYSNKGVWRESDKKWSYDKLSPEIKDGYNKSKYSADWKVTETFIVSTPDSPELYRLKVEKSDVQKKYLYFDKNGRLVRDALTL